MSVHIFFEEAFQVPVFGRNRFSINHDFKAALRADDGKSPGESAPKNVDGNPAVSEFGDMAKRNLCAFGDGACRQQLREFNHPVIRVFKEFAIIHSEMADFPVFHAFHNDFFSNAKCREFPDALPAHHFTAFRERCHICLFIGAPISTDNQIFVPHIRIRHTDAIIADDNF